MSKDKVAFIPTEGQFALSKVKLIKDGGLTVHYEVTEVVGNESYVNKYHVDSAKDIHPDLKKLFDELAPVMGRVFNITSFKTVIENADFKATKNQKEIGEKYAETVMKNIEVRGISFSGSDDNVGVVLTGLYTVANGQKSCINSPKMKFSSENFGFEEQLEEICGEIETEVYAFLFKGKKAQLELFGVNGEPSSDLDNDDDDDKDLFYFKENDNNDDDDDDDDDEDLNGDE